MAILAAVFTMFLMLFIHFQFNLGWTSVLLAVPLGIAIGVIFGLLDRKSR